MVKSAWDVIVKADGFVLSRPGSTFGWNAEYLCEPLSTMMYDRLRDLIDSVPEPPAAEE